ncbi:MAG: PaaI family thioesterase [Candidatus Binatia bacterium]|nr:PaaI family thioesterase [Candidatus Binatia bacterium]
MANPVNRMQSLLDAIPYARFLGVRVAGTKGHRELLLPFRKELIGNPILPAIHGGVLGAFLELTAILCLLDAGVRERLPKPINFSIDYLRTAGPRDTHARAEIFKLGQRIANVHVVAWQTDPAKPVASGNGKFLW